MDAQAVQVRELVLTGGPCAGKTTALSHVIPALNAAGWRVLTAPEAATTFLCGGVSDVAALAGDPARWEAFQIGLVGWQQHVRSAFTTMALLLGGQTLIIYDRAELDCAAYCTPEVFARVMAAHSTTLAAVRDSYDAVIHLVTAADGAVEHYSTANNAARTETVQQARELDQRLLHAWAGHRRHSVIGNDSDFASKLDRVSAAVLDVVTSPRTTDAAPGRQAA